MRRSMFSRWLRGWAALVLFVVPTFGVSLVGCGGGASSEPAPPPAGAEDDPDVKAALESTEVDPAGPDGGHVPPT